MDNQRTFIRGMLLVLACLLILLGVNSDGKDNKKETDQVSAELSELEEKVVYLTFDDGPSKYTASILDTLKEYDAKATFFLIGDSIKEEYEEVIYRMESEGHAIGLHCSCHDYNQMYESVDSCTKSILAERELLLINYGVETEICRLPGGSTNIYIDNREEVIDTLHNEGLRIFDWNVSAEDSVGIPTKQSIMDNIFPSVYNYEEPIVLLHDGVCNKLTSDLLPEILEELSKKGYKFKNLQFEEEFLYKS